ncbi:MAG: hypothetical protein R6U31_03005, partial [bacterium]
MKIVCYDKTVHKKRVKAIKRNADRYFCLEKLTDIQEITQLYRIELDFMEIEQHAHRLAKYEINKYLNNKSLVIKNIKVNNALICSLLHNHSYFYHKALIKELISLCNDNNILLISNRFRNDELSCFVINEFNRLISAKNLIASIKNNILRIIQNRHFVNDALDENVVQIESLTAFRLFRYYFPKNKKYQFIVDRRAENNRTKQFYRTINCRKIKVKEFRNKYAKQTIIELLKFYIPRIIKMITYQDFMIMNKMHYIIAETIRIDRMFKESSIKNYIIACEYNFKSHLIAQLGKKYEINIINFQHGGVYLADYNFDVFILMGHVFKSYYLENTNSNESQFFILGNPYIENEKTYTVKSKKKKKILFADQYIQ